METFHFDYPATEPVRHRTHVGVVGSGDLEVLLEPSADEMAHVTIRTSVDGFGQIWRHEEEGPGHLTLSSGSTLLSVCV